MKTNSKENEFPQIPTRNQWLDVWVNNPQKPYVLKKGLHGKEHVVEKLVSKEGKIAVKFKKFKKPHIIDQSLLWKKLPILMMHYKSEHYEVEKIVNKMTHKKIIYYEIKWKGYERTTWEKKNNIVRDVPKLIKEFEANI